MKLYKTVFRCRVINGFFVEVLAENFKDAVKQTIERLKELHPEVHFKLVASTSEVRRLDGSDSSGDLVMIGNLLEVPDPKE